MASINAMFYRHKNSRSKPYLTNKKGVKVKYFSRVIFAAIILFPALSVSAQTSTEPPFNVITMHPELNFSGQAAPVGNSANEEKSPTNAHGLAAAPALSYVGVYAVYSSNYGGWEYITAGQSSTNGYHGGATLRVAVETLGYGNNPVTEMNGGVLPSAKLYASQMICVVGSSYSVTCPAGSTAVGFLQYFDLDGYSTPGTFSYQATSLNVPINTLKAQILIK